MKEPLPPTRACLAQLNTVGLSAQALLSALADKAAACAGAEAEAILISALAREAETGTYLGHGLAVPHARMAGLRAPVAVLTNCPEGLPWFCGETATLVVLLVVPEERPELHLKLLSTIARFCSAHRSTATPPDARELCALLNGISA